ncbi:RDD family protein [Jatrophihabitans endophyticus]|uniref:RDD family protein n=1 Tax=Jatrophihabitans endophyticus TaxID=1206085 RepID=UPI001A05A866|nr:RDD family protein [Jatrophihabitans endophyticus]MBE7186810.1 RDD family protein [Jatrophihabitans endophyticus]
MSGGTAPQRYRGEKIGLPSGGPGSLSTFGPRLGAFLVDAIASSLVAALFVHHHGPTFADKLPGSWSLVPLAVDYVGGLLIAGRTLGMYLFGLRLIRVSEGRTLDIGTIVIRTILLFLLVPALVFDRDGRGLQDRTTDTAVVRA